MDSGAAKHMTLHRVVFDTYEDNVPRNMRLGDDNIVETIGMGFIAMGVETRGKTTRNRIMDMLHVSKSLH